MIEVVRLPVATVTVLCVLLLSLPLHSSRGTTSGGHRCLACYVTLFIGPFLSYIPIVCLFFNITRVMNCISKVDVELNFDD